MWDILFYILFDSGVEESSEEEQTENMYLVKVRIWRKSWFVISV